MFISSCSGVKTPTLHVDKMYLCVDSINSGLQDNWLITQHINKVVNGTKVPQVSVYILDMARFGLWNKEGVQCNMLLCCKLVIAHY